VAAAGLHHFSISAAPLTQALVQLVAQSGATILLADDVDTSLRVKGLEAELDITSALQQVLAELSLMAEKNAAGYYIIRQLKPDSETPEALPRIEELVVTGSLIKGGLGRSLNPLTVIGREELAATGAPTMIDLVATLPSVSGTENQSNQFHNVNSAGTANINLRGLGVSRTLVLLNGKRLATSALPHNNGQAFVDINTIPAMALEQVDILKDGAGAIYGSDAVAGVVNFITRRDYDGIEFQSSAKYIDEGAGDWDMGLLAGHTTDNSHWLGAISYARRNELTNLDREQVVQPLVDIPALQRTVYGISSIGNPGSFIPIDAAAAAGGLTRSEVAAAALGRNNYVRDPQCEAVGGTLIDDARCGFNYVIFDNLVEEEDRWQLYSSWHLGLDNEAELYGELSYTRLEIAEWKTSASYPPVREADVTQFLPASHPALVDFLADNPGILENDGDLADFSGGAVFVGRPVGIGGDTESGYRSQETLRLLAGVRGEVAPASTMQYDLSLAYARNQAESRTEDTLIDHWQSALSGFGGADCSGPLAGQNGCEYYNPFASAIAGSANFDPTLANSSELLSWMRADVIQENVSQLTVADATFVGSFDYLNGRYIDYAFGLQYRQERLSIRFNDIGDVALNPGNTSLQGELPGALIFFRGGLEDDVQQSVAALFGELVLPLRRDLLAQLALRYEHYSGAIGHSLDPKLSLRWDATPELTLRTSISTTFRAPSLNQTSLDTTSLELIGAAFAFKAVDRIGNLALEPEQATSANLGVIWQPDEHWRINLDYWRVDFSNVIMQQDANAIVNAVLADPASPLATQVIFDGSGNISRILSHYVNGPDILIDGFDFSGEFINLTQQVTLTLGWDFSYLHRYNVGRSDLLPAFSADGRLNAASFLKSMPKWKGNVYLNLARDQVNMRLVLNTISAYRDDGLDILDQTALAQYVTEEQVERFYSMDAHLLMDLAGEQSVASLSILNVADRAPPAARQDMRFDTTQHNAFGRMLKLSVRHEF